jgi:hypothetical protein
LPKFDLLFLPLLGGYLFFSRFHGTRYQASAFPAQRLLFPCAALGIIFYLAARFLAKFEAEWMPRREILLAQLVGDLLPAVLAVCALFTVVACFTDRQKAKRYLRKQHHTVAQPLLILTLCGSLFIWIARVGGDWAGQLLDVFVFGPAVLAFVTVASLLLFAFTRWPFSALLFRVSVVALILSLLAAASFVVPYDSLPSAWAALVSMNESGIPTLSLVIAIGALVLGNLVLPPAAAAAYLNNHGSVNDLNRHLFQALRSEDPVHFSTQSKKVYVGLVKSMPAQTEAAEGYFVLLPLMSGYRTDADQQVELTTFYDEAYSAIRKKVREDKNAELREELRMNGMLEKNPGLASSLANMEWDQNWDEVVEEQLEKYYRVFPISEVISLGFYDVRAQFKYSGMRERTVPVPNLGPPDVVDGSG